MQNNNVTRDLMLLGLYQKKMVFYFSPSSTFLSSLAASVVMNLILNKKVYFEGEQLILCNEESSRPYNKQMIEYIKKGKFKTLKILAQELFLDNEFMMEILDLVIVELVNDNLVKLDVKKQLILNKHTLKLVDPLVVKESYHKLFETLYLADDSQEFVALTLLIDTFYDLDEFFDEEQLVVVKDRIKTLHNNELFEEIKTFKSIIDEFYLLIARSNTNYFGV